MPLWVWILCGIWVAVMLLAFGLSYMASDK